MERFEERGREWGSSLAPVERTELQVIAQTRRDRVDVRQEAFAGRTQLPEERRGDRALIAGHRRWCTGKVGDCVTARALRGGEPVQTHSDIIGRGELEHAEAVERRTQERQPPWSERGETKHSEVQIVMGHVDVQRLRRWLEGTEEGR